MGSVSVKRHRFDLSYLGVLSKQGEQCPTWRIELLDDKNKPTDIWSEVWLRADNLWVSSNGGMRYQTITEALQQSFESLLDYLGVAE